ncbi:MAG: GSCFA domain-containing protein [Acidobacteriota bacterium]
MTFGSCFARHLGPALRKHGFTWLETEPPPHGLSRESASRFGYGHFTCRTGTLATPTALRQWLAWALGDETAPADPWVAGERFFDPFRPTIEPDGFVSRAEMLASRQQALRSLRRAIREADVFLFTLGMTESWVHDPEGWVYPACPGTAAGRFDATRHRLVNLSFAQARAALVAALERLWAARPGLRMLLTVSPVPLTATASGHHVVTATTESKAILRAVAGEVAASRPVVDYFPSYELVTVPGFGASRAEAPAAGETLFEANRRTVSRRGVARVMREFFVAHGAAAKPDGPSSRADSTGDDEPLDDHLEDPHCDDAWAEAFG